MEFTGPDIEKQLEDAEGQPTMEDIAKDFGVEGSSWEAILRAVHEKEYGSSYDTLRMNIDKNTAEEYKGEGPGSQAA
jgi:hypothetical protein